MTKLRNIPRRKLLKALPELGFTIDVRAGKGSHANVYDANEPSRVSFVPNKDPVKAGTLQAIIRDLNISREDLERVL